MDYFVIGEVARPHGVCGELKVIPHTEDAARFDNLKKCYIKTAKGFVPVDILSARKAGGCIIMRLDGVYDRNAAESWRGKLLYIDRANAIPLPEGRYFISDLIDMDVFTDAGEYVGKITDVLQPGANDVYVVKGGSTVLMPALKSLILDVDIKSRRMTVSAARLAEVALRED